MPREQKHYLKNLTETNSKIRKNEIKPFVDTIDSVASLMRTADSIIKTDTFHLDVKEIVDKKSEFFGDYKVDLQFTKKVSKPYTGKTVAVVILAKGTPNTSLNDLKEALMLSATDQHLYRVT